jgi:hypothetical protein
MATWHQLQRPANFIHPTQWTVVIDPPGLMRALERFDTKDLADVYMRNLKANNPVAHKHAFICKPMK